MTLSGFRLGQDSAARPHASHHWPKGLPLSIWNQGRPPSWQAGAPTATTQTLQQARGHSNTERRHSNNRMHRDPWRRPGRCSTPGAAPSSQTPRPQALGPTRTRTRHQPCPRPDPLALSPAPLLPPSTREHRWRCPAQHGTSVITRAPSHPTHHGNHMPRQTRTAAA